MRIRSKIAYYAFASLFCLGVLTVGVSTAIINESKCKEKLIIDVDAGVDDAIAILLVLNIQKHMKQCLFEIVAVTSSYGNTSDQEVLTNIQKTLTVANRPDIPIYAGAKRSLLRDYVEGDGFFGKDGFGEYKFDDKILCEVNLSMHASLAMIELSKKYEGKLNILVVGPLTNVALAGSLDRGFFDRVKDFYVMGSSVAGVGNAKPNVEFNFAADPEANFILLNSMNCSKITILPWETALNSGYNNEWRKTALQGHDSKTVRFINGIESIAWNKSTYYPCDIFAATAMLMGDKFVKKALLTKMDAVVDGAARGSVLVDYAGHFKQPNVKIIQSIDIEFYKAVFICAFAEKCWEF